jgi:hypothetical protein
MPHARDALRAAGGAPGARVSSCGHMSNLSRRPGNRVSRSARERRAFQLVVVGGTAAAIAAVTFVLALIGVMGFGIFLLAAIVAVIAGVMFRGAVGR